LSPQTHNATWWHWDHTSLWITDIDWNLDASNTIEFIVHNNATPTFENHLNPVGLSASIQAVYQTSPVPEPAALLMWSLGGVVLTGTTWIRKRRMKKTARS